MGVKRYRRPASMCFVWIGWDAAEPIKGKTIGRNVNGIFSMRFRRNNRLYVGKRRYMPYWEWEQLCRAPSKGEYWNDWLKGSI